MRPLITGNNACHLVWITAERKHLEQLKECVKKLRVIFPEFAPANLFLTEIINRQIQGREMVITVANWNKQKQAILDTFKPSSCTDIPMSLEDIFIECTKPNAEAIANG